MIAVLRQRDFSLLWFGGVLSSTGDWLLFIALPFFIYERTGSALATGAMFAAETLPRLLFGSVAGVFVDRWDRKRTMIFADVSRAAILVLLLMVAAGGPLALIYVVVFVEASLSMLFIPAKNALVPNLVEERQLTAANSLNSMAEDVPSLIGPVLGGALFAVVGLNGLIALDIVSYLLSAAAISLIVARGSTTRPDEAPAVSAEVAASAWANALRDWLGGLRVVGRDRKVAAVFTVISVATVGEGVLIVLMILFFKDVLGVGTTEFGYFWTCYGLGYVLGGLLLARLSGVVAETRLFALALIANGALLVAMFNFPVFPVLLVLAVPAGITVIGWLVVAQTLLQKWVPDRYMGRVFGAFEAVQALALLTGMGLAVLLSDFLGTVVTLTIVGGVWSLAGLIALLILPAEKPT
jgi:MFS family permease